MIPAEAIEAAARAYFKDCGYAEWDHMAEGVQAAIWADMRAALEAAAPHMLAGAWDEAIQDADDEGYLYTHQSDCMKKRNPYRPTQ